MNATLTVLVPVYNAQDRLLDQIERLLDLLPEMTKQFEIVVIDDGSTDETGDIAEELSMFFPQVSFVRHAARLGLDAAIQSGLNASVGDLVVVADERHGILADDLINLWQLHGHPSATPASATVAGPVAFLSRVLSRSPQRAAASARPLVQIVRRRNLNDPAPAPLAGRLDNRRVDASSAGPAPATRPSQRLASDRLKGLARGE